MNEVLDKTMTAEELIAAGEALYGAGWKGRLAFALDIKDEGRIAKMADGRRDIPVGFRREIAELAREKSKMLSELADALTSE